MWNFKRGRFNVKLLSKETFISVVLFIAVSCLLVYRFHDNSNVCREFQHDSDLWDNKNLTRNFLTVFLSFPVMTDPSYRKDNFDMQSTTDLKMRMLDFIESLQFTLAHPYVLEVYLIYEKDVMPAYIAKTIGKHSKLNLVQLREPYIFLNVFNYVHTNFKNRLVMITNADIYPDEGLDKINYDLMKQKRLVYVPTRRGRPEKRCNMYPDQCDREFRIPGAHDVYIYVPTSPIPPEGQVLLNKTWDTWGIENVILHVFASIMCYKPLNPCKIISMYHNHCSRLRHNDRQRFDIEPEHLREFAEFSDKLQ